MFITKMALPRRTFLRGMGATLALPLLDAMVPALSAMAKTAANPVPRLGFVFVPMGTAYQYWTPKTEGAGFEITPTLTPLAPYRDQMLVVTGLDHKQAYAKGSGDGDHLRGKAAWLTGVHPKKSETEILVGVSADQLAARELGKQTPLESLQIALDPAEHHYCNIGYSCALLNTFSYRTPTVPLLMEPSPRVVFEQLFGEGGSAAEQRLRHHDDRSILDSLAQEAAHLQSTLGPTDRKKVGDYLDAVRDIETRIRKAEAASTERALALPNAPVDTPDDYEEHAKVMFDLQVLAYQADITRVASMLIAREESLRSYPNLGVYEAHHPLSHHQDIPEKLANLAKVNAYHLTFLAYFLEKMRATPDGDGNLLDHSMILYGSGLGNPHLHDHHNLPTLLLGGGAGKLKGGRHIVCPEGTPMTNLLVSMLDKVGVPVDSLGDSTGKLFQLDEQPSPLSGI